MGPTCSLVTVLSCYLWLPPLKFVKFLTAISFFASKYTLHTMSPPLHNVVIGKNELGVEVCSPLIIVFEKKSATFFIARQHWGWMMEVTKFAFTSTRKPR
jgi:hypothetical protein